MPAFRSPVALPMVVNRELQYRIRLSGVVGEGAALLAGAVLLSPGALGVRLLLG